MSPVHPHRFPAAFPPVFAVHATRAEGVDVVGSRGVRFGDIDVMNRFADPSVWE